MEEAILIFTGTSGAIISFLLNEKAGMGAVRGSALPSLIVGLFFYAFPEVFSVSLTKNIPLVFFGASFIGMVSSSVLANLMLLGTSGAIFSLIFISTSQFFTGYGGALGTTASIALLFSLGIATFSKSKIFYFFRREEEKH